MKGKQMTMQSDGPVIKVRICNRTQVLCAFLLLSKAFTLQKKKTSLKMALFQGEKNNLDVIIW